MRRNLEASHGLFFSQRVLLALVESGLSRDDAYRLVQGHAMRAWDEELDFRELVQADDEIAGRVDLDAVFDLDAYTRHVDTVFDRLHALARRGGPSMPEAAVHVASGKVREIYALDDERLLLVASDRISTFDVVLPDRDPGQGPRPDRPLRLLVHADARDRPEPPARPPRRRPLDGVPAAGDAADRVRRARLPRRLGLEGLPATRSTSGHALPEGLRESDRLPEPIFTPATKATTGHDENIDAEQAAELVGAERFAEVERRRSRCTASPRSTRWRAGSSSPTRSSSSASTPRGSLVLGDEALTPDSSRFWPADEYEPGGPQPSFDKQFVRDYCETLGWDKTAPGPELPDEVVAGTRAQYVEAFERLTGDPASTATSPTRRWCSREGDRPRPPEARDPRPAGPGGRESLRHLGFPSAARASAGSSTSRWRRPTPRRRARRSSGCASSSSRTR